MFLENFGTLMACFPSQSEQRKAAIRIAENSALAPRVGFEPTTIRLTVGRSTTELPRNAVQNAGERSA